MTTNHPNPIDYLKYTAAEGRRLVEYVQDRLGGLTLERPLYEDEVEELQTMLDELRQLLAESAATFSRDGTDLNRYSDGRQIESVLQMELGNAFAYRWHPDPRHPDNQPHTIVECECTSGARRTVLVAADQILDTIDHTPRLYLVDGHE